MLSPCECARPAGLYVEFDAVELAYELDAVRQPLEGQQRVHDVAVRQAEPAADGDGGHDVEVVVRAG